MWLTRVFVLFHPLMSGLLHTFVPVVHCSRVLAWGGSEVKSSHHLGTNPRALGCIWGGWQCFSLGNVCLPSGRWSSVLQVKSLEVKFQVVSIISSYKDFILGILLNCFFFLIAGHQCCGPADSIERPGWPRSVSLFKFWTRSWLWVHGWCQ